MKIKMDNDVFIIPESNNPIIVEFNGNKDRVIDCLSSYFLQKKKTRCRVFDDFGKEIRCDEANFVYVSRDVSIDSNMELRSKSIINNVLSELVRNNPDDFLSIDVIRDGVRNLMTDKGMYKVIGIMTRGIASDLRVEYNDVKIPSLIESILLEDSLINCSDRVIYLYNLLLNLSRDSFNVILVDSSLTEVVETWIQHTKSKDNLILIDNEYCDCVRGNGYNLLSLSNQDFCEELMINEKNVSLYSYLLHPVVRHNKQYQTEKNREIITEIEDKNTTFFLKTS